MKLIERIEKTVNSEKTIDQQLKNLSQFDNLSEEEKLELTTYNKSTEVGILIEYLGHEKLINYLPNFIQFLQDANWPSAGGAAKMLKKAEIKVIPEIKRIFKEEWNDKIWHYWILILLIDNWNEDIIKILKPELIELINIADQESASIEALRILKTKNLLSEEEVNYYYHFLLKKFKSCNHEVANDLISELNEFK